VEVLWNDGSKTLEPGVDIKRTTPRAYAKLIQEWRSSMGRVRKAAAQRVAAVLSRT
jgi:hypothetical protein